MNESPQKQLIGYETRTVQKVPKKGMGRARKLAEVVAATTIELVIKPADLGTARIP